MVKRAFEADWQRTRIASLVGPSQQAAVKRTLALVWTTVNNVFKHYAGVSNATFGMSWMAFDHFVTQTGLLGSIKERKRVRTACSGIVLSAECA